MATWRGGACRLSVARVSRPSVPSLPHTSFAKFHGFPSGNSSSEYPPTRRITLGKRASMSGRCRAMMSRRPFQTRPSADGSPARRATSSGERSTHSIQSPVGSSSRPPSTCSIVRPYRMLRMPLLLLPIMPAMVARLLVEVSGANSRPWDLTMAFSSSRTMPVSTVARRASASMAHTRRRCLLKSMTTATLVAWPARLVPPPRGSTGAFISRATATAASTSSSLRGVTTASGTNS